MQKLQFLIFVFLLSQLTFLNAQIEITNFEFFDLKDEPKVAIVYPYYGTLLHVCTRVESGKTFIEVKEIDKEGLLRNQSNFTHTIPASEVLKGFYANKEFYYFSVGISANRHKVIALNLDTKEVIEKEFALLPNCFIRQEASNYYTGSQGGENGNLFSNRLLMTDFSTRPDDYQENPDYKIKRAYGIFAKNNDVLLNAIYKARSVVIHLDLATGKWEIPNENLKKMQGPRLNKLAYFIDESADLFIGIEEMRTSNSNWFLSLFSIADSKIQGHCRAFKLDGSLEFNLDLGCDIFNARTTLNGNLKDGYLVTFQSAYYEYKNATSFWESFFIRKYAMSKLEATLDVVEIYRDKNENIYATKSSRIGGDIATYKKEIDDIQDLQSTSGLIEIIPFYAKKVDKNWILASSVYYSKYKVVRETTHGGTEVFIVQDFKLPIGLTTYEFKDEELNILSFERVLSNDKLNYKSLQAHAIEAHMFKSKNQLVFGLAVGEAYKTFTLDENGVFKEKAIQPNFNLTPDNQFILKSLYCFQFLAADKIYGYGRIELHKKENKAEGDQYRSNIVLEIN